MTAKEVTAKELREVLVKFEEIRAFMENAISTAEDETKMRSNNDGPTQSQKARPAQMSFPFMDRDEPKDERI